MKKCDKCHRCAEPMPENGWCRDCWWSFINLPEYKMRCELVKNQNYELAEKTLDIIGYRKLVR